MVSVMSASRYVTSASHYQSRYSMYIRGLISRNSTALAEAVPIGILCKCRQMDDNNQWQTPLLWGNIDTRCFCLLFPLSFTWDMGKMYRAYRIFYENLI